MFGSLLYGLIAFYSLAFAAPPQTPLPVISRIAIYGTDVYDMETYPYLRKFPYTWINGLHIQTQQHVIERELLFKVGDRVDPFLLQETERNLRALSFIRAARVVATTLEDGTAQIDVYANDSWTTEPHANVGGLNGFEIKKFGFEEKNVLGLGKRLNISHEKGTRFDEDIFVYDDPRVLGSRWKMELDYAERTRGAQRSILLHHPFFSADTPWSVRGFHNVDAAPADETVNNIRITSYEKRTETNEVYGGLKLGTDREIVRHIGLRYNAQNFSYKATDETDPNLPIPEADKLRTVFLDYDSSESRFIEMMHLEKMTRVEDVNLGWTFRLSPGVTPKTLFKGHAQNRFEGTWAKKTLLREQHLLDVELAYEGREPFREAENQRYKIRGRYYQRMSDRHTLVYHTRAEWVSDPDPGHQVTLGEDNGLRAFEKDALVGEKSFVANLESRRYFSDEIAGLFSVGGAAFIDTGNVWSQGERVALNDLYTEVGLGLRLGLTRTSNEMIFRFDLTYRLNRPDSNDSKWVLSIGSSQAF